MDLTSIGRYKHDMAADVVANDVVESGADDAQASLADGLGLVDGARGWSPTGSSHQLAMGVVARLGDDQGRWRKWWIPISALECGLLVGPEPTKALIDVGAKARRPDPHSLSSIIWDGPPDWVRSGVECVVRIHPR